MDEATWYAVSAMMGWVPSEVEPTPYDFRPHERWRAMLSERLTVENVQKLMLRFELGLRSTGLESQGAAGRWAGKCDG